MGMHERCPAATTGGGVVALQVAAYSPLVGPLGNLLAETALA
jgi:hypothetical protein